MANLDRYTAGLALALALLATAPAGAQPASFSAPAAFDVAGRTPVLTVHAVGAQIYECKPGPAGALSWVFREPIAALFTEGKTVGRHYAGPTWELTDGSAVKGAPAASAPGATAADAPLLKLNVAEHRGDGALGAATVVLRLNTHGGALAGACANLGDLRAEPYSADYVFLR